MRAYYDHISSSALFYQFLLTVDLGLIFHREKAEASLNQAQTPTKLPIFYFLKLFMAAQTVPFKMIAL